MQSHLNVTPEGIIPVYQRYVDIDEDIHQKLSLYTLSLYVAFRFAAQFGQDSSRIKRTAQYMADKAKISKRQYFISVNELEAVGLIKRDPTSKIGEVGAIYIARHLWHFTPELAPKPVSISTSEEPMQNLQGAMQNLHTLFINSSHKIPTDSNFQETKPSKPRLASKKDSKPSLLREMIDIYREIFPDNPQPHKTAISTNLEKTLRTLIKRWPEVAHGEAFTLEYFRRYLRGLKELAPKFSLKSYTTEDGREKKNDLLTFCRWNTVVSFSEDRYS